MPYPNEHSARLKDPGEFNPNTFRRVNDGTIYGKIKVPQTIAVIWGKLKGHDRPADQPAPQAIRFSTKSWTATEAKKWLKDNNVKYISFEPAGGQKDEEKQSAPVNACIFRETPIVGFTDDDQKNNQRFRIVAYSGQIIPKHWFWGNVAFDLKGVKFDKSKTPILEEHARNVRVGFTTMQDTKESVVVEGKFLSNDSAQKIRSDMVEGFPMQASVMIQPGIIERVEDGNSTEVNGLKLKGPGTVFRKSTIYEVSLCCLGADNRTSAEVYDRNSKIEFDVQGDETMADEPKTQYTKESFAADYPDLFAEITAAAKNEGRTEGEKTAREQIKTFAERFGKDPAFCLEQLTTGATIEAAMTAYTAKLQAENEKLLQQAKELAAAKAKTDPAKQEFADDAANKNSRGKQPANTEEGWKKEFAESKDLQAEFGGDEKAYVAYKQAESKGQVSS